jgi:glycosyltransferase involved in cell wall biosynthesis
MADGGAPAEATTAIVVKGYPRLSETFIAQEILGLQRLGQRQLIVSLRRPTDAKIHPVHREIAAPVLYLPEYLHDEPRRVRRGWAWARRQPGYPEARRAFLKDLRRDPTRNRVRRFGQACVLAAELPGGVDWLHTHYLHTPCSATRYAAAIRGLGWSFSAHAKDIWTTPARELREKLADAAWGVTCTAVNRDYLAGLADDPGKVSLVYHGLDFSRFPRPMPRPPRDGSDPADPVRLLSVGRAVEKKGFDVLLEALARLPDGLHWRWTHIGGGELAGALKAQAERLRVGGRVEWLGAQAQDRVVRAYKEADLFVLAAKIARSGDRDGLPNVLMEAQATGLCCLASDVSAIPELIADGRTGRLVPPESMPALAGTLRELIADPAERARLGMAGAERVRRDFAFEKGLTELAERFRLFAPAPDAVAI